MMLPAKPISSPGRSDKFPPPLMRFLRTNAGSKSRGRLRSSPMFVRKKNATAVETQEPSSPKVTCMGQVRVRRASSAASSRPGRGRRAGASTRKRCGWIHNAVFCSDFPGKIKPKSCRHLWRRWVPFFQAGFCSRAQIEDDPPKIETRIGEEVRGFSSDEEEEEREEQEFERKAKVFALAASSSSPPKNALLLTRCRSAPYRSSSLACRFWGSPNRAEEETGEEEQEQSKTGEEEEEEQSIGNRENERPQSGRESTSDQESRIEQKNEDRIEFFKGLENSIRERMAKSASIEDSKEGEFGSESARPLILTRCKSEPASRTAAEKLDPDSLIHSHQVFVIN
ncbi:uncharacterized protein LOC126799834 [Argentina anserina]|uniref:uncharacterized protein LOC126799834 n=1 Tax=Argentina anserina TaxID=57926 RepID=UPI0021764AA2|nr:uncharacterized protein LOC126799834 [Potentilla anserina]